MRALILSNGVGFSVFYALHVTLWRRRRSNAPRIFFLAYLMAIGLGVSLAVFSLIAQFNAETGFVLISTGIFIYMGYAYYYSAICRSVSLTLLGYMLRSGPKTLSFQELVSHYAASDRFEDRLVVMEKMGWLRLSGESVMLTPSGIITARLVQLISRILCGGLEG